jgi:hypothetical protein
MKIHNVEQGSPEWHALRLGIVTASNVSKLITATGKIANNDTVRKYALDIASERVLGRKEPEYESYDMIRGKMEEIRAFEMYCEHHAKVEKVGFVTEKNIGYSPDGLVGKDGLIEIKSAKQRIQFERIIDRIVPSEHIAQIQTGLLVTGRKWCDFVSFSNGMPLLVIRVFTDYEYQLLIIKAVKAFEEMVKTYIDMYKITSNGLPVAEFFEQLNDDIQL